MAVWRAPEIEELIAIVKLRVELQSYEWQQEQLRTEYWEEIAPAFTKSPKQALRKWRSLFESFKEEWCIRVVEETLIGRNKAERRRNRNETCDYYDSLRFLIRVIAPDIEAWGRLLNLEHIVFLGISRSTLGSFRFSVIFVSFEYIKN